MKDIIQVWNSSWVTNEHSVNVRVKTMNQGIGIRSEPFRNQNLNKSLSPGTISQNFELATCHSLWEVMTARVWSAAVTMCTDSASRQSWRLLCNSPIAFGPVGRMRKFASLCSLKKFAECGSEATIGDVNSPRLLEKEINYFLTSTLYFSLSIYSLLAQHWHEGVSSLLGSSLCFQALHTHRWKSKQNWH